MTIAFICSSLRPGYDGVGDYTRRLAAELVRQGHKSWIIALSDQHLNQPHWTGQQWDELVPVDTLRLSSLLPWKQRVSQAAALIEQVNPDWISLQYVPYGFHPKGLPYRFAGRLRKLSANRHLHIMLHELWLDDPVNARQSLTGYLQKKLLTHILNASSPAVVNASIPFNIGRLRSIKRDASLLGLFGNVPFHDPDPIDSTDLPLWKDAIELLYFGAAPKGRMLENLLDQLTIFCQGTKKMVRLTLVGAGSDQKVHFLDALDKQLSGLTFCWHDVGFATQEKLSELMQRSQLGIARMPPHLLGKSGTAIAMLEHGLPIWLPGWDGKRPLDYPFRTELIYPDLAQALQTFPRSHPPYSLLADVARQFFHQLYLKQHYHTSQL